MPGGAQVLQTDGELSTTTQLPSGETDTRDKYKRVCVKCEVALRKQDWGLMSEEEKAQNPNYTEVTKVEKAKNPNYTDQMEVENA